MDNKLDALINEKNEVRKEILMLSQIQYYSLFSFIALLGVFVGAFRPGLPINNQAIIIFAFGQIEFIVIMLSLFIMSSISILAGYARTLEDKINQLLHEPVTIWESQIVKNYLFKRRSGVFFVQSILWLFYLAAFFFIIIICHNIIEKGLVIFSVSINKAIISGLQLIEFIIMLISVFVVNKDSNKVEKLIKQKYFLKI